MSYTKTTWQTNDTITKDKLNNIESGIENLPHLVPLSVTSGDFWNEESVTLDASVSDLLTMLEHNQIPILIFIKEEYPYAMVSYIYETTQYNNNKYSVRFTGNGHPTFYASTTTDALSNNGLS